MKNIKKELGFKWDTINRALMNKGYTTKDIADVLIAITKQNEKENDYMERYYLSSN